MQIFRSTKKETREQNGAEGRSFGPPLLSDRMTQSKMELYVHKQLTLLARFGLGGCSETPLTGMESDALLKLGCSERFQDPSYEKWVLETLETHFPKAFRNRKQGGDRWDCLGYFLGDHNKEVTATPTIDSEKKLCLARRAEIMRIMNRSDIKKLNVKNIDLLNSKFGDSMRRIGLVRLLDRTEEHVFLDFLPRARIGSRAVVHWSIACDLLECD